MRMPLSSCRAVATSSFASLLVALWLATGCEEREDPLLDPPEDLTAIVAIDSDFAGGVSTAMLSLHSRECVLLASDTRFHVGNVAASEVSLGARSDDPLATLASASCEAPFARWEGLEFRLPATFEVASGAAALSLILEDQQIASCEFPSCELSPTAP